MRKSYDFEETTYPVTLTVHTKCPEKWILMDRETGQTYVGNSEGYWDKLNIKDPSAQSN